MTNHGFIDPGAGEREPDAASLLPLGVGCDMMVTSAFEIPDKRVTPTEGHRMTDSNIGPHGKGCKCPPGASRGEPVEVLSRYRGDMSKDNFSIYEFLFGGAEKDDAAIRVMVRVNRDHPNSLASMVMMENDFGEIWAQAIRVHAAKLLADLQVQALEDFLNGPAPAPEETV